VKISCNRCDLVIFCKRRDCTACNDRQHERTLIVILTRGSGICSLHKTQHREKQSGQFPKPCMGEYISTGGGLIDRHTLWGRCRMETCSHREALHQNSGQSEQSQPQQRHEMAACNIRVVNLNKSRVNRKYEQKIQDNNNKQRARTIHKRFPSPPPFQGWFIIIIIINKVLFYSDTVMNNITGVFYTVNGKNNDTKRSAAG